MPQVLKEEIRTEILQAALEIFAEKGYRDTSLHDVARKAGLSTGNIYRYFADKKALYDAALPAGLMEELSAALDRKLGNWRGQALEGPDKLLTAESRFRQELSDLLVENRLHWIVLLREGTGEILTERLMEFFERWLGSRDLEKELLSESRSKTITNLYRNLIGLICSLLREALSPEALKKSLDDILTYHLAGLEKLIEVWSK